MTSPAGWIFQAVPEQYDLRRALLDLEEDVWLARQRTRDMVTGQKVFFWLARKGGGLVATGHILGGPSVQAAPGWQLRYWTPAAQKDAEVPEARVRVRYTVKFAARPIARACLLSDRDLASQRPIGPTYVGTNFAMSDGAIAALEAKIRARR